MQLKCDSALAAAYKSRSQCARVITESWCANELYCANCKSNSLLRTRSNTQAGDFKCPGCGEVFELKSARRWNQQRVADAGYEAMMRAIREDRTPNLLLMQCSGSWSVNNLLLIPRFFFTESAIEKRSPLRLSARRAGWVGCNILLSQISDAGKILVVSEGSMIPPIEVRSQYRQLMPLAALKPRLRGWTLDVLKIIQCLDRTLFSLRDIYSYEKQLSEMHPANQNVRPKIRQQVQVLRDLGLLQFLGQGQYHLLI